MDDETAEKILDTSDNEAVQAEVRALRDRLDRAEQHLTDMMFEDIPDDVEIAPDGLSSNVEPEETPVAPDGVEAPADDEDDDDEMDK